MNEARHSLPLVEAPAECALIVEHKRPLLVLVKLPLVAREELAALRILIRQMLRQPLFLRVLEHWIASRQRLHATRGRFTVFCRH